MKSLEQTKQSYVPMHASMHVHNIMYVCVCMYYMHVCIYTCMYVCMCVYVCMYVYMYVCMYICMYVYMYVCTVFIRIEAGASIPYK